MGALGPLASSHGAIVHLHVDHDIGRSERSRLVLSHPSVSSLHARIRWSGDRWMVRDLGSRNGTFVNDRAVEVQRWHALASGDRLMFGDPAETWSLVDAAMPRPLLVPADGTAPISLGSVSPLPSADDPRATIFRRGDGSFVLEEDGAEPVVLRSGDRVKVGRRELALHLPDGDDGAVSTSTADDGPLPHRLSAASLTINAAPDEETAEVYVAHGAHREYLPPRVHLYVLLHLARLRSAPSDDGWLACEVLCDELRATREQLAIHVFRIRDDFKRLGFSDAGEIVDRRRRGWIRIGIASDRVRIGRIA
jgi:hypothetical protein